MNKSDPAGALAKGLQQIVTLVASSINVALPCKVLSYNSTTHRARVQPLIRTGVDVPAVIEEVPALGQRLLVGGVPTYYPPALQDNDVVLVVFSDRQIRDSLGGQVAVPESSRSHDLNDAVIVGVFG
jgi:hypothetical protein